MINTVHVFCVDLTFSMFLMKMRVEEMCGFFLFFFFPKLEFTFYSSLSQRRLFE